MKNKACLNVLLLEFVLERRLHWLYGIPRISAASGVRRLFEGGAYELFCPRCGAYSRAALMRSVRPE